MGRFVQRRQRDYHSLRYREMDDLDRAASAVLAFNYSRRHAQTTESQRLIQMDCVALCMVQGEYWIASNSQHLEGTDIDEFANYLGEDITCWIVRNGTPNRMHAEMQLLKELLDAHIDPRGMKFGVSKPCCKECADKLNSYGVEYTHYHDDNVVSWESPD